MKTTSILAACAVLLVPLTACMFPGGSSAVIDEAQMNAIVLFGDTETESSNPFQTSRIKRIIGNIRRFEPAAVFHLGDLVHDAEQGSDWAVFNHITEELRASQPFYPVIGNHEKGCEWIWYDNWELPNNEEYYSVDIENLHVVVLNSNKGFLSADPSNTYGRKQYDWLLADLEAAGAAGKTIVLAFHHPLYTSGKEHVSDENGLGPILAPLIEAYGIKLCVNGHNHSYEHLLVNGTHYVTSGGGGKSLYDQGTNTAHSVTYVRAYHHVVLVPDEEEIRITAYDIEMNEIDSFSIEL